STIVAAYPHFINYYYYYSYAVLPVARGTSTKSVRTVKPYPRGPGKNPYATVGATTLPTLQVRIWLLTQARLVIVGGSPPPPPPLGHLLPLPHPPARPAASSSS